ncbi:hypothetical protein [Nocardia sp. NPDC051833]|uniref:hypothetical protein n=1 Tax=Nocardia sp. NPDC051833 TaxID=3155674 RepID=UPI003429E21D
MSDRELLELIRVQIEEPAFARIRSLMASGQLTMQDAAMFRASADRYKAAMLAEYSGYDPRVRNELLKSLITDYGTELDRLIEAAVRHRSPHHPGPGMIAGAPVAPRASSVLAQRFTRLVGRIGWKRKAQGER